jgi:CTP:molybdopterin cytidylyltransferase MocA
MGKAKALLDAGGESFLARILDSLREGGADPRLVVVRTKDHPVAEEAEAHGGTVILNPDPTPGPISSLQAGLGALDPEPEAIFFAPVDHPLFAAETVRAVYRCFLETGSPLVIPAFEGWRGHPVLFGRRLFPELMEEDLPEGARTVVRRYLQERVQVEVSDPGILADIDTPEEYKKHFRRSP